MPRGLIIEENVRAIATKLEMTTEQVRNPFIYPRSFFAPNQPEPTPPVSTFIIYPYDGGGFFPS